MESLDPYELGYLAGFLDGDGSIQMGFKRRISPKPTAESVWFRLTFFNTNKEVIQWIADLAGTNVSVRPIGTVNKIQRKEQYVGYIVGRYKIKDLLTPVLPYLRVKRDAAILLLEGIELAILRRRGEAYPERMYEIATLIAKSHDKGNKPSGPYARGDW